MDVVTPMGDACVCMNFEYREADDWEQWLLLGADHHIDSPHSQRDLLQRHLRQARERQAGILQFGDLFDLMQGRYDPRSRKSEIRPEHQRDDYLDQVIDDAAGIWAPYGDLLLFQSPGNHERSILKRLETDPITRFGREVERLWRADNPTTPTSVHIGKYTGWIKIRFRRAGATRPSGVKTWNLAYTHGYGGGGPVTRGVIQTNRRAVYLPDAHIVLSGHIHESWYLEIPRERLLGSGRVVNDLQIHMQLPTYKEESLMQEGWHRERGAPPKPLGGWWLRFHWSHVQGGIGLQAMRTEN